MFKLHDPGYLLLLVPVALAAWRVYGRRVRAGLLFPPTFRLAASRSTWRMYAAQFMPALLLLGLALIAGALARPQTVFARTRRSADAIAIEMVVDVSGSMMALDMSDIVGNAIRTERTRLDAVKSTFGEFMKKRPDDLVGLISFGGYVSTRAPLTLDHNALLHVLAGIEVPRPTRDGLGQLANEQELLTAIGDALATACARLQNSEPKSRIVVLLSDGVSNTGVIKPEEAVEIAKTLKIKVYTIGVGSTGLAPFKARDLFGRETIVVDQVSLDEPMLRNIADSTGGQYFNVRNAEGLDQAMEEINKLERTRVQKEEYADSSELFHWLLTPGLVLIVLGSCLNVLIARRIA